VDCKHNAKLSKEFNMRKPGQLKASLLQQRKLKRFEADSKLQRRVEEFLEALRGSSEQPDSSALQESWDEADDFLKTKIQEALDENAELKWRFDEIFQKNTPGPK
jgi:hypothetical protein